MAKFNDRKSFGHGRSFGGGGFSNRRDGGRPAMHRATCSECGQECELPFRPTGDRPVFCNACFGKQGDGGGGKSNVFRAGERRERPRFEDKQMFDAVCGKCGAKCRVPFRPAPGKQVFCDNCFGKGASAGKGTADYTNQFKMLNEKLDKLIKLLSPNSPAMKAENKSEVEIAPVKKIAKEAKKISKAKPAVKKTAANKKK